MVAKLSSASTMVPASWSPRATPIATPMSALAARGPRLSGHRHCLALGPSAHDPHLVRRRHPRRRSPPRRPLQLVVVRRSVRRRSAPRLRAILRSVRSARLLRDVNGDHRMRIPARCASRPLRGFRTQVDDAHHAREVKSVQGSQPAGASAVAAGGLNRSRTSGRSPPGCSARGSCLDLASTRSRWSGSWGRTGR